MAGEKLKTKCSSLCQNSCQLDCWQWVWGYIRGQHLSLAALETKTRGVKSKK